MSAGHGARKTIRIAAVLAAVSLVVACTGGPNRDQDPRVTAPRYAPQECPVDVEAALLGTVECGVLQVPEDRGDGIGSVSLLVTSLTPAGGSVDDPLIVVGTDLATRPNYAGIGPVAQRTGRRVIFFEQRGTAHSVPSLACPVDDPAETRVWSTRTGSLAWRHLAERAVATCFKDLAGQGIDVAVYGVREMSEDLADLIEVLDLGPVDLISYGSASRILLELLRRHPSLVRAAVLDSPDVPGVDPRAVAAATVGRALRTVLRWCQEDRDCRARHDHPSSLLHRALTSLSRRPLQVTVTVSGSRQSLVLDPAFLVRVARQSLTDGGSAGTWGEPAALPRLLTAVVERDVRHLSLALTELLGSQGPWCAGYRAKCMSAHTVSEGVWNTVLCRDIAPDGEVAPTSRPRAAGLRAAYDRAWWWQVCPHWHLPRGGAQAAAPVRSDVPVLVLAGGLAAPTPYDELRAALAGLTHASFVIAPTQSHNTLGEPCLGELRNSWLKDPRPLLDDPDCLPHRLKW